MFKILRLATSQAPRLSTLLVVSRRYRITNPLVSQALMRDTHQHHRLIVRCTEDSVEEVVVLQSTVLKTGSVAEVVVSEVLLVCLLHHSTDRLSLAPSILHSTTTWVEAVLWINLVAWASEEQQAAQCQVQVLHQFLVQLLVTIIKEAIIQVEIIQEVTSNSEQTIKILEIWRDSLKILDKKSEKL